MTPCERVHCVRATLSWRIKHVLSLACQFSRCADDTDKIMGRITGSIGAETHGPYDATGVTMANRGTNTPYGPSRSPSFEALSVCLSLLVINDAAVAEGVCD